MSHLIKIHTLIADTRTPEKGKKTRQSEPQSLINFENPSVYHYTVSRTLELSLQSSFQLSLTVLVCYRSRGHI